MGSECVIFEDIKNPKQNLISTHLQHLNIQFDSSLDLYDEKEKKIYRQVKM